MKREATSSRRTRLGTRPIACGLVLPVSVVGPAREAPPILVEAAAGYRVLLGSGKSAAAARVGAVVEAYVVPEPSDAVDWAEVDLGTADLRERALAVHVLSTAGVSLAVLARHLDLPDASAASRLAALSSRIDAEIARMIASDRNDLKLGHLRPLARMTPIEQRVWLGRAMANHWSVAALTRAIKASGVVTDPDLKRHANLVGDRLGAPVVLERKGLGYECRIGWTRMSDLLGILESLGRAPMPDGIEPVERRDLVISVRDGAELDVLFAGVLTGEG